MEKMTLSRALRYKKRVVEKIRLFESDIQNSNTIVDGEERDVDVRLALKQREAWVRHLVDLKLTIQQATQPIQRLVLELAETKSEIAFLQRIGTQHGTQQSRYSGEPSLKYVSEIRKQERDKMVSTLQDEIDKIQTKIDAHNAETTIEVTVPELP
jgi:hypothetical protein